MHGGMSTISKGQALITMVNSVVGLTELKGNYVDCRLLQLLLHESNVKKAVDFFVANVVDITWTLSLILMVR